MKKYTEPLEPDTYYHIFNRGINGTRIFTKKGNTEHFLQKYIHYIEPVADTFAYVLMGNHFHYLIKTKSEFELLEYYQNKSQKESKTSHDKSEKTGKYVLSKQFSNLFNAYAQAINKQDKRTGGLFEEPFRRIPIDNEYYLHYMIYYIHHNPVKHGFTDDFTIYPFSSYNLFLHNEPTFIKRNIVLNWFNDRDSFLVFHGIQHDFDENWVQKNWIEIE